MNTSPINILRGCRNGEYSLSISATVRPVSLLDACLRWTDEPKCLADFLPRLSWKYMGRENGTSCYYLMLDDMNIGWAYSPKKDLPKIEETLIPGYLDDIPSEWEILSYTRKGTPCMPSA